MMSKVYADNNDDAIKNLVETMMICLLKCDNNFSEWWSTTKDIDRKIILEDLEESAYIWLSNNGERNWLL